MSEVDAEGCDEIDTGIDEEESDEEARAALEDAIISLVDVESHENEQALADDMVEAMDEQALEDNMVQDEVNHPQWKDLWREFEKAAEKNDVEGEDVSDHDPITAATQGATPLTPVAAQGLAQQRIMVAPQELFADAPPADALVPVEAATNLQLGVGEWIVGSEREIGRYLSRNAFAFSHRPHPDW
eukprot:CAMPEP_0194027620 /NCGR_PEP_ID=MMETSP0009_2-20130614/1753_1 /TAXON_ID=210454 /ORGANISM="Grammatophora oceanica, Strain CCMP 410" /LENGTH=185 /DNA_ID=CAMNT_0038666761 /DNA_START=112 /DNA_END=666 /DNA_ORIENTATION=+